MTGAGGEGRSGVGAVRLWALRAGYALLVVGLGLTVWPALLGGAPASTVSAGVVRAMLAALSALAVVGLWRPLAMLPLLLFELGWKAIWLLAVAAPLLAAGRADADVVETAWECALGFVFLLVIPWDYVATGLFARRAG